MTFIFLDLWSSQLLNIPEQNLFSKINLLTLFLIDWKCIVQYCLHPNLVIYLIQLKVVFSMQR